MTEPLPGEKRWPVHEGRLSDDIYSRVGRLEGAYPEIHRRIDSLHDVIQTGFSDVRVKLGELQADLATRQEAARRRARLGKKATWAWGFVTAGGGAALVTWWHKIQAAASALLGGGSSIPPGPQ